LKPNTPNTLLRTVYILYHSPYFVKQVRLTTKGVQQKPRHAWLSDSWVGYATRLGLFMCLMRKKKKPQSFWGFVSC